MSVCACAGGEDHKGGGGRAAHAGPREPHRRGALMLYTYKDRIQTHCVYEHRETYSILSIRSSVRAGAHRPVRDEQQAAAPASRLLRLRARLLPRALRQPACTLSCLLSSFECNTIHVQVSIVNIHCCAQIPNFFVEDYAPFLQSIDKLQVRVVKSI